MKGMSSYHKHIETPSMSTDEIAKPTPIIHGELTLLLLSELTSSVTFSMGFSEVSNWVLFADTSIEKKSPFKLYIYTESQNKEFKFNKQVKKLFFFRNNIINMKTCLLLSHLSPYVPFIQPDKQRPFTLSHLRSKHWWLHWYWQFSSYDPTHSVIQSNTFA